MPRPYNVININGHIVPATFHGGLKKMSEQIRLGRVMNQSKGRYVTKLANGDVCHCGIGAMLTDAQLAEVTQPTVNNNAYDWKGVSAHIGRLNAEAVVGMSIWDAIVLQRAFDAGSIAGLQSNIDCFLEKGNRPNPATKHSGAWHFPVSGK